VVLQPRSLDWKAEHMHTLVFHSDNIVRVDELPKEIRCLSPLSDELTEEEEDVLRKIIQSG
jgi:hypothetical protein